MLWKYKLVGKFPEQNPPNVKHGKLNSSLRQSPEKEKGNFGDLSAIKE